MAPSAYPPSVDFSLEPAALPDRVLRLSLPYATGRKRVRGDVRDEIRSLLEVPDSHAIYVMHGSRELHFDLVPMHFLQSDRHADYLVTGRVSRDALTRARLIGDARETEEIHARAAYVHMTSANAEEGRQWHAFPPARDVPVVCDMTDDLFTRRIDIAAFALIYAEVAGVSVVIARRSFIDGAGAQVPPPLRYSCQSVVSAPLLSVFLAWARRQRHGHSDRGLPYRLELERRQLASELYAEIEAHPSFYRCPVEPGMRSRVHIIFDLPDPALRRAFLRESAWIGLTGLERESGLGVSLSGAIEGHQVRDLIHLMRDFHATYSAPDFTCPPDFEVDVPEELTPAVPAESSSGPTRIPLPPPFKAGTRLRFVGPPELQDEYVQAGEIYTAVWEDRGQRGTGELEPDPYDRYAPYRVNATKDGAIHVCFDPLPGDSPPDEALGFGGEVLRAITRDDRSNWEALRAPLLASRRRRG